VLLTASPTYVVLDIEIVVLPMLVQVEPFGERDALKVDP
jgi:hypothetical protein